MTDILELLDSSEDGLSQAEIELSMNARPGKIRAAIKYLSAESPAPLVISSIRPIRYSRTLNDYELPHEAINRIMEIKEKDWRGIQEYLRHDGCLMQFLARGLDDDETKPCGKCANCAPESRLPEDYLHETGVAAAEFTENIAIEIPPKLIVGFGGQVAERFPVYSFPPRFGELAHESGRALCRWGDPGWGEVAMEGKRAGAFDVGLVDASATMISERWLPQPSPMWVTYVPSRNHPTLVPRFAEKVASKLGLPCVEAVRVVRNNQPQKQMENTHHRCRNLDGVFEVTSAVRHGAVLLIDDAVDSGWTFAVISALLKRAGAGPVFPFAILSTATGS